jgi:Fe-S-cluster containining protein
VSRSQPDRLATLTEQWFHRAAASLPGQLPCRQGCSHCCVGLFSITILDADRLTSGLGLLPPDVRTSIIETAQKQIAQLEAAAPRLKRTTYMDDWPDAETDRLSAEFGHLPCPALSTDGTCQVYLFRPIACRTMGIPEERAGLTHGACDVQTFVPIRRLSERFRQEEQAIAGEEAAALDAYRQQTCRTGEELWLPYGFVRKP